MAGMGFRGKDNEGAKEVAIREQRGDLRKHFISQKAIHMSTMGLQIPHATEKPSRFIWMNLPCFACSMSITWLEHTIFQRLAFLEMLCYTCLTC